MIKKKMGERAIEYPILSILRDEGSLSTTQLKQRFREFTKPSGDNLTPLHNRNDEAIDQIIRNIVSHRYDSSNNMIYRKLIEYTDDGMLTITDKGKGYLRELSKQLYSKNMQ